MVQREILGKITRKTEAEGKERKGMLRRMKDYFQEKALEA